jgi:hypothetical protein
MYWCMAFKPEDRTGPEKMLITASLNQKASGAHPPRLLKEVGMDD